jgi:hypothetical protein
MKANVLAQMQEREEQEYPEPKEIPVCPECGCDLHNGRCGHCNNPND